MDNIHQIVESIEKAKSNKLKLTRPPPPNTSNDKFYLSKYVDKNDKDKDDKKKSSFCFIF